MTVYAIQGLTFDRKRLGCVLIDICSSVTTDRECLLADCTLEKKPSGDKTPTTIINEPNQDYSYIIFSLSASVATAHA